MNFRAIPIKPTGANALAQQADFEIGSLSVSPSCLEIRAGGKHNTIQPRVMQVLVTVAAAKGAVVSRDELIEQCWGGRIVGEDAITRCVAKVRELATFAGTPAFEIETIPRVGYRLMPAAPAVSASRPRPAGRNIVLAVLAFDNLSSDQSMAYFSEGMSEEILQSVSRIPDLRVIGRSSSFRFRGAEKAAAQVGRELKATHILDGSVRRSRSKIRISASLIECAQETTLWSDSFERELSDVLALQDEIAPAVAAALNGVFLPPPQVNSVVPANLADIRPAQQRLERAPINPAAYLAYLQGRFHLNKRNRADMYQAVEFFKEALAIAPDYADARASIALTYALLVANGQSRESLQIASQEAALALDQASDHFAALASSAVIAACSWRWAEAFDKYQRLHASYRNNAEAHHFFGAFLTTLQLPELCLREHRIAVELNPLSALDRGNMGESLHMLGREEEAIPEYSKSLTLDPKMAFSLSGLCVSYANTGRLEAAKALHNNRLAVSDGADGFYSIRSNAIITYNETGGGEGMLPLAHDAEQKYLAGSVNPGLVGLIHTFAGNFDAAISWFQKSIDEHDLRFFQNTAEPSIPAAFKSDPRWRLFMQQPALQEWARVRNDVIARGVG
jgi:TolB-like protein/Tfp pilus assembly protein PilF